MNKLIKGKKNKAIIIILALVLVASFPVVGQAVSFFQKQMNLIQEVFEYIEYYHISDVSTDELTKGAINGMIDTLDDPYTTYFTDEEYKQFVEAINNTFVGIGIYVDQKDEYIIVQSVIKDSPAEKAGLQSGDAFLKVDGVDVVGKKVEEVSSLIRGKEGTTVNLTIKRQEEVIEKSIVRAKIQLPLVEAEMLANNVGYIRLYTFSSQSADEFDRELKKLEEQGMEKLILDLRDNSGGYLESAKRISKNFIKEGPIAYIKYKNKTEETIQISGGADWTKPMVVLINNGSASASEILASSLQDYNKATIIGENSFGKGTVQSLIDLEGGGYLKLTINEYFTPKKKKINGIGVIPDIEVTDEAKQLDTAIKYLSGDTNIYSPTFGKEWIRVADKDYVALRELVNYFNGTIKFKADTKTIAVTIGEQQDEYPLNSNAIYVKNGKSYIAVDELKNKFSNLVIEQIDDKILIFLP